MAYICTDIINQGTEDNFLNAIGDFFESNGLVTFSVTRNFDEEPHNLTIDYQNIRLEISSKGSQYGQTSLLYTGYLVISNNLIQKQLSTIPYLESEIDISNNATRNIKIMLVKNENAFFLGIGGYNERKGHFSMRIYSSIMTTGERLSSLDFTSYLCDDSNINTYYPYVLHKYPSDNTKLILEKNIAIAHPDTYRHYANLLDLHGLSGETTSSNIFYLTDDGLYYAIQSNLAIKMGNEMTYISNENT